MTMSFLKLLPFHSPETVTLKDKFDRDYQVTFSLDTDVVIVHSVHYKGRKVKTNHESDELIALALEQEGCIYQQEPADFSIAEFDN